jgi:hypothetical protein
MLELGETGKCVYLKGFFPRISNILTKKIKKKIKCSIQGKLPTKHQLCLLLIEENKGREEILLSFGSLISY